MIKLYFVLVYATFTTMCLILMRFANLCCIYQPGKARRKGLHTYTITPESLLLCHNGKVKFSLHTGKDNLSNPDTLHTKGNLLYAK